MDQRCNTRAPAAEAEDEAKAGNICKVHRIPETAPAGKVVAVPTPPARLIVAGVVTYNPDEARLTEALAAVRPQVNGLVLIDNASSRIQAVRAVAAQFGGVLVENPVNRGMAVALNQVLLLADKDAAEYALLLDQDSVPQPEMVAEMVRAFGEGIGMVGPAIIDRNLGGGGASSEQPRDVIALLTSGSLLSVAAWESVGGYDEQLFVDFVDFDFCLRLSQAGWRMRQVPQARLLHELGAARRHGRFIAYNHSATRCRHIAHDMLLYARKHQAASLKLGPHERGLVATVGVIMQRVMVVLMAESSKWAKVTALLRGTVAGLCEPISEQRAGRATALPPRATRPEGDPATATAAALRRLRPLLRRRAGADRP